MLATHITNHTSNALKRLLQQYKGRAGIENLLSVLIDMVQEVEDAIFSLDAGRQLFNGNAIGAQLDIIGSLFNVPRNGLPDGEYLVFILATILADNSDTTLEKMAQIVSILFNCASVVDDELFPAAMGFQLGSPQLDPTLLPLAISLLKMSLGAGIGLGYVVTYEDQNAFSFLGSNNGLGFGDSTNAAVGGKFATVVFNNLDV